jgi:branched-chain amino acid transport system permease protein
MLLGYPYDVWIAQLFTGLVNGCVFILLALGLSIIFGLLGIINFAHGIFYMLGAYAGWTVLRVSGNFWLALIVAPIAVGLLGALTERTLFRPVYRTKNPTFSGVLVAYGLAIFAPDFIRLLYGRPGKPFAMPPILRETLFTIAGTEVSAYRIFVIAVTAALLPALWFLLNRTNLGMVIRAGTTDTVMVQALGINISRIWTIAFGLGTALAAFAGVMTGPLTAVTPEMGGVVLIQCFIVVVVGGMGSFTGAVVGGLLIGQVLTLTGLVYDLLGDIIIYLAMAVVLLVRPRGLFGEEGMFEG